MTSDENFFLHAGRARIDNDRKSPVKKYNFLDLAHDCSIVNISKNQNNRCIDIKTDIIVKAKDITYAHNVIYSIYGNGCIVVASHVVPSKTGIPLARLGITMVLDKGHENLQWYGRGPHENYIDRLCGAPVGVYKSTVSDQYIPYPKPQETGNKCDVRWVGLTDSKGDGVLITGDRSFSMSALHYTASDLGRARHTIDLKKRPEIILSLNAHSSGLGNGSCGPGPLEKYIYKSAPARFSFMIQPISGADNLTLLGRSYRASGPGNQ